MYYERLKTSFWTFHNGLFAFNQVKDIYAPICFMTYRFGKPMASCFNKLSFMKAGLFLYPSLTFRYFLYSVNKIFIHPLFCSFPIYNIFAMINIYWPGLAILIHSSPIIKLKGKYIGSCTNLQDHAICCRTVYCSSGNEDMIMFFYRPFCYMFLWLKINCFFLGFF